jgi:predicted kinase
VLSGLPGTGKTTIAREAARELGAVHVRIDSIEAALRAEGHRVEGEGYAVAYAIAEDNLRLGRVVIADCVNPWPLTRAAWHDVATHAGAGAVDVEIVCSDPTEHRRRVESRAPDIPGHSLPAWQDVLDRDYQPWAGERLVIDTASVTVAAAVRRLVEFMRERSPS